MRFSIVIPTHSRPGPLSELLAALASLDYPREAFEVIVVVDGGARPSPDVIARAAERLSLSIVEQPQAGPAAARNRGAAAARGTYLAFTDDDCLPSSNWLGALEKASGPDPSVAVGGPVLAAAKTLYTLANHLIWEAMYEYHNASPDHATFFVSCNFAVPRAGFLAVGGFDETFQVSEDREFCHRWTARGHRMVYAPEMRVRHAQQNSLWTFWLRHLRYGHGAYRFHRMRASEKGAGVRLSPVGLYWKLFSHPFRAGLGLRVVAVEALIVLAQAALTVGLLSERWRRR